MNQPIQCLRCLLPAFLPFAIYLFFTTAPVESSAQSVVVHFINNESVSTPVADIQKMRVQGNYLRIYLEEGPFLNYHLGTVARYEFDFTTNLENQPSALLSGFTLFPNPTSNKVTATIELPFATEVQLGLMDVQGREIMIENHGFQTLGEHQFEMLPHHAKPGYYLVQVITQFGTAVEPLLITPLK